MQTLNQFTVPAYPRELGFSDRISLWRPGQAPAIERIANSDKKLIVVSAPTGAGKSTIAYGAGRLFTELGEKVTILTHQKGLQQQYLDYEFDYGTQPVVATGRVNHMCILDNFTDRTAAEAPCTTGHKCHLRQPIVPGDFSSVPCPYYQQLYVANANRLRILNYPLFIEVARRSTTADDLGNRQPVFHNNRLLICDEGHRADKAVLDAVSTTITLKDQQLIRDMFKIRMPKVVNRSFKYNPQILEWANDTSKQVTNAIIDLEAGLFDVPDQLRKLSYKFETIEELQRQSAVVNYSDIGSLQFKPVLSEQWAPRLLLRYAKKTVLMSATIIGGADYWAGRMGVAPEDTEYIEVPSNFPIENRRVFFWPVVQMNHAIWSREEEMLKLIRAIDRIIAGYMPYKGLIHTANKRLAYFIRDRSKFAKMMYVGGSSDGTVDLFKEAKVGVLVSYSATEGVDLPDDLCRYTIFAKVPWLPKNDPVIEVQMEEIPGFYEYEAAASIVQGVGRGMRHENDWCVNFILDSSWRGLYARTRDMLPEWFKEALVQVDQPPMPEVRSA